MGSKSLSDSSSDSLVLRVGLRERGTGLCWVERETGSTCGNYETKIRQQWDPISNVALREQESPSPRRRRPVATPRARGGGRRRGPARARDVLQGSWREA